MSKSQCQKNAPARSGEFHEADQRGDTVVREQLGKLNGLTEILEPAHLHFGYRTAEEILGFLGTNHAQGANVMDQATALDHALLMKILPKMRGQDSPEFRDCLDHLHGFLKSNDLHTSAKKVAAMKDELELTGTTRFWR